MEKSRQLAAIMFTDIIGYTAMMGEDEHKAFELLHKNRQLQRPIVERYHGRWIKELGDGILASFASVSDAVFCAIAIQQACNKTGEYKLHIGIHQGEVIFEGNDIFGDGVNIASRIQAIAPEGGIWISDSVFNNITNKKNIQAKYVQEETLKNVNKPIRIYEIIMNGTEMLGDDPDEESRMEEKSIAVLPFVNMSNDPDQEYFSDGIAEDIITSLSHLKNLKVAGRTSSFQFKGKNIDLREVGEQLGVKTLLEGSVRKQKNKLRISAQLVKVEDGFHIWSQKFDRNIDDIFAIQDEIALAVTEQLKVILFDKDREKISKCGTTNTEAYELYLKGIFYIKRRGYSIRTGLECIKKAIEIDPDYAQAYTGYAEANVLGAYYNFFAGRDIMEDTRKAIEKSISLNKHHAGVWYARAQYYVSLEWDWKKAEENYLKAIELDPELAQAHSLYGMLCLGFMQGRFEDAEEQGRIAIKIEPLSAIDHADLAWTLYQERKFDEALEIAKTGIELDNSSFLSQRLAGLCHLALNNYDEAIATFNYLVNISKRHQHAITNLIWALCGAGKTLEANKLMDELNQRAATEYIGCSYAGISMAYLGNPDAAIHFLEKALSDRDPILISLKYAPHIPEILLKDQRFGDILNKVGFRA